jgi:hypothetical protein
VWQNQSTGATSEWLMSANGGAASFPGTPAANDPTLTTASAGAAGVGPPGGAAPPPPDSGTPAADAGGPPDPLHSVSSDSLFATTHHAADIPIV